VQIKCKKLAFHCCQVRYAYKNFFHLLGSAFVNRANKIWKESNDLRSMLVLLDSSLDQGCQIFLSKLAQRKNQSISAMPL
jgi:hypothetical protein